MNITKTLLMSTAIGASSMLCNAAPNDAKTFDIDCMMALGRVSSPCVSPDGKTVLFAVNRQNVPENKSNTDLYTVDVSNPGTPVKLTDTDKGESQAVWIDNGKRIAFVYADDKGEPQMWIMNSDGTDRHQATSVEGGIGGFLLSPDQSKIVIIGNVKYARTPADVYPDLPKANARIIDDLMYKHWDEWVTEIPHPFVGTFDGNMVKDLKDIMADEPFEAPMKPFGGVESFAWSPDGNTLIYVSRKKTGLEYAISTNSNLYAYNLIDGTTTNLTPEIGGYDTMPQFSKDGRYLAWLSMERDGYEADKNRLMVRDMTTGQVTDLTKDWDYTIDEFAWNPDGKSLWFIAYKDGVAPIFKIGMKAPHKVEVVAEGVCDYTSLSVVDSKKIVTMRHSLTYPNEIFTIDDKGNVEQLTDINAPLLGGLEMPVVEKRMIETSNGEKMLTWVVKPPKFDESKQYPALLYCQGGPQSAVSQFWSYRWNPCLMASNGYVIVMPNRHGVPGFGTKWEEQISGDYPGQNMRDYLAAIDNVRSEKWIDTTRVGAVGASYGGFSIYWLAGNHDHRFAALLAHAGIFNTEAQYLETEEMWFANWDMGGAFWEKDNAVAQRTHAASPHRFVDKWDTPIMITHGEYDYRILSSQGQQAFNAAKLRGIPAEMVLFPEENHWILRPQNAVLWHRLFFRWFDRWLKDEK